MLKVWHEDPLIADYDVRDLTEELQEWVDEGFLEADIWLTLGKRINPSILPKVIYVTDQIEEMSSNMEPKSPVAGPFLQVSSTKIEQFWNDNF